MGGTCLLIYEDLDDSFNNWPELSTFDLELTSLTSVTPEFIDKKIDESISSLAIATTDSSVKALALIGIYLNLDAATLLGDSKAGQDESWIKECEEIKSAIKNNRNLKSDKEKLVAGLAFNKGVELLNIIQHSTNRKTPVFLIGDCAVALAYLTARSNSQAKDFLHVASRIERPGLLKAIENSQIPITNLSAKTSLAKGLAISLLTHM